MRKLLLFFAMLSASIGAWAGSSTVTTVGDKSVVTITVSEDPDLSTLEWSLDHGTWVEQIVLANSLNQNGGVIKFVGDAVNASAVEPIIALKSGNTNYGLENYFQNIVLDFSQITLNGEITSLPAKQGSGFVVTTLIYTEDTGLPSWVENSDFLYAFSNASTGTDSYLYATEDMTNLPSGLTVDANKTYHLTGTGVETMKDKLVAEGVPEENIIYTAPLKATITYDAETKVATVNAPAPGLFKKLIKSLSEQYPDGTIFKFDSESKLNAEDLSVLAGENITHNVNFNKYYIDLYDIPVGTTDNPNYMDADETKTIEDVISETIDVLRTNNWQYKGLLLPKNPKNVGTTLIQDREADATKLATCSQFIAYNNGTTTVAHVYNTDNTATATYNSNVTKMEAMFELHSEIGTNTTAYLVTTNSTSAVSMTALPSTATRIETFNNEMVGTASGNASIIAYPSAEDAFYSVVNSTSIQNTPTERLEIIGVVGSSDLAAIGNFQNGPRVLDLRNATGLTAAMVSAIQNSSIEYLLLPNGWTKEDVNAAANATNMTGLKAAISVSNDAKELVAYINEPGSLAQARSFATGGTTTDGILYPTKIGLTSVTLSGYLNASDINAQGKVAADGHWAANGDNVAPMGLNQEQGTIVSFDLEKAVFENQYDMNFNKAAYEKLTSVVLPTSDDMTIIPAHCLDNNALLKEICISHNYKYIEDGAFWGTGIDHITATDASGAVIDNGPLTYTLPASLLELGIRPEPVTNAITCPIFNHNMGVTDIYSLATKAPKCYKNVFPKNACNGWGGFNNKPYCRDKYYNGDNVLQSFAVLRFPSEESFNATDPSVRDNTYGEMKQHYTDVNKVYTKKEQTGAVDANGDPITWPTLEEIYRVYNQASLGLTWNDWKVDYTDQGIPQVIGGQPEAALNDGVYTKSDVPEAGTGEGDYNFDEYAGWHQLVLCQATYVEPDEYKKDERYYEEAGLYTFCIPFDMTIEQVREMMGVPASNPAKNMKSMLKAKDTGEFSDVGESPLMPEIYQLHQVTREKATSASGKNRVHFILTSDLYNNGSPQYLDFEHGDEETITIASAIDATHPNRCLVGGRPYIIKAYKRVNPGAMVDQYKISGQNLGKYIMTHYADEFGIDASCLSSGLYEQLYNNEGNGLVTLRFAIPYEQHKVQAMKLNDPAEPATYDNGTKKYYYTMVGQFWQQPLPQYCIYMSKGIWYRYTNTSKAYTWDPFKCIIMPTQELVKEDDDKHYGGGYRDITRSNYPVVVEDTDDKLESEFKLGFLDGRDDDDFTTNGAKYMFIIDNGIDEYDAEGNLVTAIKKLDGEDLTISSGDGKVYNMSGQYVGKSVKGLPKGMYIVNGKKYVVK